MEQNQNTILTKKDYFLITFIGIAFALFTVPILKNLNFAQVKVSVFFVFGLIIFFAIFANIALFIASLIAKKIPVVLQVAKFAAVGAFNTFLDWGIVNLLMAATAIFGGFWYGIFNGISFIVANSGSYFWSKYWTFSSGNKHASGGYFQFFGVTFIGFLVKIAIAYFIVTYIGHSAAFSKERWANVGIVFGTVLAMIWNFIGYKFFVFKK
jgi:putative flippase GtrA